MELRRQPLLVFNNTHRPRETFVSHPYTRALINVSSVFYRVYTSNPLATDNGKRFPQFANSIRNGFDVWTPWNKREKKWPSRLSKCNKLSPTLNIGSPYRMIARIVSNTICKRNLPQQSPDCRQSKGLQVSTIEQLRHALSIQTEKAFKALPTFRPPTRAQAKRGRVGNIRQNRAEHKESMLNMPRPAGHRTLPRFPSEREKVLFAAHAKRRESGWIRG